ncbi:hypothetical protein G5B40_09185 [Pikeienuella piscinae]|uniref:Uncharacterized protein n=1 Tax=Pikeienuella piscinae TaxID=2748098 RepID=A0A7L5BV64_9RHOB|nr:DUF6505 family protein [Pikeienuella piscinae]QIE55612.1 hypothetical protein G5B40_09185 [Pikeienuella piscinae]
MRKLARTIHFDESDRNVFARPAASDEWALSGGFEFSNWTSGELTGKARQAFANGWLGLESFGRATFVAVAKIEQEELDALTESLAAHFETYYGAPGREAALAAAREEIGFMEELCEDQEPNTLLIVERELTDAGVREKFRAIRPQDADITQVAVHGAGE